MRTWTIAMGVALALLSGCSDDDPGVDPMGDAGPPTPPPMIDAGTPDDMDVGPMYPGTPETVPDPTSVGAASVLWIDDAIVTADPYRDRIYVARGEAITTIDLEPGDQPGALLEDGSGRVHVALRRGGALATLNGALDAIAERRPVCPAPRGLAFDPTAETVLVACAGGDLVTLPAAGGAEVDRVFVDSDLRDVIVTESGRYVTRFRSAELITLDSAGAIVERRAPLSATISARPEPTSILPNVAWRTVPLPDGDLVMLHQRSVSSPIDVNPMTGGGYGSTSVGCATSVVQVSLTRFPPTGLEGLRAGPILNGAALAVDLATLGDDRLVVTNAGANDERVQIYPVSAVQALSPTDCLRPLEESRGGDAVATRGSEVVVYQREPAMLRRFDTAAFEPPESLWLDAERSIADPGHELFHQVTTFGIACASCHPDGSEDGHTWVFEGVDPRRTQTLLGGILSTVPFHWSGDQPDLEAIMVSTFDQRMGGGPVSSAMVDVLGDWMDAQPSIPAPQTDPSTIAAGEEVFIATGCADCHSGDQGTNNESVVFEGSGAIQVPMLVGVAHRSPWLHDGCAQSLAEAFDGACIPEHAPATPLEAGESDALVDYLRSL